VEVVLLPKPKGQPGDRRPVCLLPVLYRLWAAARRGAIDRWRADWAPVELRAGALELSWRLAAAVLAACEAGEPLAGIAFDFQKAFDTIGLGVLAAVLERAGWPEAIRRPMLAAYGHPRLVREAGVLGRPWAPQSGIIPGCPLAVAALATVMAPRCRRLQAMGLAVRPYVDDLTAWGREADPKAAAELAAAAAAATCDFAAALGLRPSPTKCRLWATSADARRALRGDAEAGAPAVTDIIPDLGLGLGAGKREGWAEARQRAAAAVARAQGCGPAPPPPHPQPFACGLRRVRGHVRLGRSTGVLPHGLPAAAGLRCGAGPAPEVGCGGGGVRARAGGVAGRPRGCRCHCAVGAHGEGRAVDARARRGAGCAF
jgi:hypothetical protein